MNGEKQVAFDPRVCEAWQNLAVAILNPHYDADLTQLYAQSQPTDC